MKRIFAVALAAGLLLLGGCGRQHAQSSARPDVGGAPAATAAATGKSATTGKSTSTAAGAASAASHPTEDVTSLLGVIDKQLSSDSQPARDSD